MRVHRKRWKLWQLNKNQYNYNPQTGILIRLFKTHHSQKINVPLGLHGGRSCYIRIGGIKKELTHWIWFYQTGQFPTQVIDHIDGNKQNNKWENLRQVSQAINLSNKHYPQTNNKSGYLGVSAHQGKYKARLKINGKQITLWPFTTPEAAHEAYLNLRSKYHPIEGVHHDYHSCN